MAKLFQTAVNDLTSLGDCQSVDAAVTSSRVPHRELCSNLTINTIFLIHGYMFLIKVMYLLKAGKYSQFWILWRRGRQTVLFQNINKKDCSLQGYAINMHPRNIESVLCRITVLGICRISVLENYITWWNVFLEPFCLQTEISHYLPRN